MLRVVFSVCVFVLGLDGKGIVILQNQRWGQFSFASLGDYRTGRAYRSASATAQFRNETERM